MSGSILDAMVALKAKMKDAPPPMIVAISEMEDRPSAPTRIQSQGEDIWLISRADFRKIALFPILSAPGLTPLSAGSLAHLAGAPVVDIKEDTDKARAMRDRIADAILRRYPIQDESDL